MSFWRMVPPLMRHQGEYVLKRLQEHGHQAYFVGGCVRDEIMGRPVHDMDIATSARPEEVLALFERTVPTGLQHGTVTVLAEQEAFEVTTFRKEADYEDHRHPTRVEFVDGLLEDLRRRDFTMNAIAADAGGNLTDPFGGRRDIEAGVLRCVGDAGERFDEDALRMMRAIRFASVFGFRPVKSLWSALKSSRSKISFIAIERIRAEFEKMLLGPDPLRGLVLLQLSDLLPYIKAPVPPAALRPLAGDNALAAMKALAAVPPEESPELRYTLLLQGIGVGGEEAAELMKRWTFPNAIARRTADLILFDELWKSRREEAGGSRQLREHWVALQLRFGKHMAALWLKRERRLLAVRFAEAPEKLQAELDLMNEREARWHEEIPIHTLKELAIRGEDVIRATGRKGGPWLGRLMDRLLFMVASGELPNAREILLEQAKVVVNEDGAS
ncbi:CCA tRNA nucleotidyltransferase [Paenibacillus sanfengchensis]|uniref:CCA tRNA nucleotidyltransferase n=1 Tax=Paenibacillus sanfengchensis TaxID=3119819 RepID=UPI002FE376DC